MILETDICTSRVNTEADNDANSVQQISILQKIVLPMFDEWEKPVENNTEKVWISNFPIWSGLNPKRNLF